MDINELRSLVTLVSLLLFVGLMVWTWSPSRRDAHARAARLALEDEAPKTHESTP